MKTTPSSIGRHARLREAYQKELGTIGNLVEGSLSPVRRSGRKAVSWQLTFKTGGKTRTVYVPVGLAPEVRAWTKEFKRLKQVVRKITRQSLAIIRRHATVQRAASRGRRPKASPTGGISKRSCGTSSRT
jgi:hypothetical protein